MTRFYPEKYLEKVMPGGVVKNGLLYDNLSIKQRYMRALYKAAGKEGKALQKTIADTVAYYAKREEGIGNQALLSQRIENFLVWNKVQEEKQAHQGEFYRWLPSDAENPDPEHQLLYGQIFRAGEGDKEGNMPGERYGCRCGIEWLDEKENPEIKVLENTDETLVRRINSVYANAFSGKKLYDDSLDVYIGKIQPKAANKIKRATGVDVKGFRHVFKADNLRHGINRHAYDKDVAITADKVALIPHIVNKFDKVKLEIRKDGNFRLRFVKKIKNVYTYVATVGKNKKRLLFKTFFGKK